MSAAPEPMTEAPLPLPSTVDRLEPLTEALEAAGHARRLAWMRSLAPRELFALYDLAKGSPVTVDDLVGEPGEVVIWEGKNNMLLNSLFQKRFARLDDEVVGFNHNSAFTTFLVGPGHFVCYDSPEVEGETWIDYRRLPARQHPDFPPLVTNDRGIGPRVTYGGMVDILRRVASDLLIGFAVRKLPPKSAFALCRTPRPDPES